MVKQIEIILLILFGCVIFTLGAMNKSCLKDADCENDQFCSFDKCKNACSKNPCAPNTVCKVRYLPIFRLNFNSLDLIFYNDGLKGKFYSILFF